MNNSENKIVAILGPTNTGKTYMAIEKMLEFNSGIFGLPLRLLAREVYDKCVLKLGTEKVALITGEEKIIPSDAKYYICTVESMPKDKIVDFVAVDEIQMCGDTERGHIFTDRLLNFRGEALTMFLGSQIMKNIISQLLKNVEFINQERFSKLSYNGSKKISRLNRKSAIIAFSIEEVYALAELVRRQKGGSAVIMGSLSPKTRNSQVELYQSGDVDYLVATDAIGMGINMDIEQINFSSLRKFDGKKRRRLRMTEISQIAGRAGRFKNDGYFGITGDCENLEADEIERIEKHNLDDMRFLYWRNSKLDFSDPESLINSLEKKSGDRNLHKISESIDENILKYNYKNDKDFSNIRITLDEEIDLGVLNSIVNYFAPNIYFTLEDIINLYKENKSLFKNVDLNRNEGAEMSSGQKMWKKAKKIIPGGNMLLSKRTEMFHPLSWPAYFDKAKGCNIWDLDGNKYLDMSLMGVGTNILGYANSCLLYTSPSPRDS